MVLRVLPGLSGGRCCDRAYGKAASDWLALAGDGRSNLARRLRSGGSACNAHEAGSPGVLRTTLDLTLSCRKGLSYKRQRQGPVPRFERFATGGVVAPLFRLQAPCAQLKEARNELGTLLKLRCRCHEMRTGTSWSLPGAVEAMRMVSEGAPKATGTEVLDGLWGHERSSIPDRRAGIPMPPRVNR